MFSGIIDSVGTIASAQKQGDLRLSIACDYATDSLKIGESVACNGACLTVIAKKDKEFSVELSAETLNCTTPRWQEGMRINLERSLKLGDRLDGHLVSGHVDGLAKIVSIAPSGDSHVLTCEAPVALTRFITAKGSVTLDGVSLTVNQVEDRKFSVNIIPHTWKTTTFSERTIGDSLNLEVDLVARYVAKLVQS
jgi:riboflavin synthase